MMYMFLSPILLLLSLSTPQLQSDVTFIKFDIIFIPWITEFGRNAQIISYTGNRISIRKVDGAILFAATSSDIALLYELTRASRWEESLRLVRVAMIECVSLI